LLANFQNEWQIYGADGLPFLADSYDEAAKLYKAQKPLMEKKLAEQGMGCCTPWPWPPQGIYSKKPLNSGRRPEGHQVARLQPGHQPHCRTGGRAARDRAGGRTVAGLATGVVESTMTSGATGVDSKLYEHLKYYYDMQAWLPKNAVIVNKAAFDALDKATAGRRAEGRRRRRSAWPGPPASASTPTRWKSSRPMA
jgi:TRAP-type C4-dicarboxylate transport system substrate-binding protein